MAKPSLPQGTRDFGPETVRKRNYIFNTIREVFELYGFQPLETPAMENLETLMGKYGDEGDKLIYRILDSGNPFNEEFIESIIEQFRVYLKNHNSLFEFVCKDKGIVEDNPYDKPLWEVPIEKLRELYKELLTNKEEYSKYLPKLKNASSGKALRYDLTIPFARYVAMNHGQLSFPFKRYQIQPVWRADRPQRGRYREFYQCDADVVGSNSLLNEIELVNIYATVFSKLGIDVEIRINSRKILAGIAETIGESDRIIDVTVAIDKVDKIGIDGVKNELRNKGFNEVTIKLLNDIIFIEDNKVANLSPYAPEDLNLRKLYFIKNGSDYRDSSILQDGVRELENIYNSLNIEIKNKVKIDLSLARGLNYYTGIIFEIKAKNVQMGSIGGGGRYDDLTGLFGVPNIPGVGISFGVDRIYDVMEELKLFPDTVHVGTQVLFFNLGETEAHKAFELMQQLREKNIRCELFHETAKFDKQFKYAEKKSIPYAIIIGSKELEEKTCVVKDLRKGEQRTISMEHLFSFVFH